MALRTPVAVILVHYFKMNSDNIYCMASGSDIYSRIVEFDLHISTMVVIYD